MLGTPSTIHIAVLTDSDKKAKMYKTKAQLEKNSYAQVQFGSKGKITELVLLHSSQYSVFSPVYMQEIVS